MTEHRLALEPQPIADQWMGRCACGHWQHTASLYQFNTREAAIADIEAAHTTHLDFEDLNPPLARGEKGEMFDSILVWVLIVAGIVGLIWWLT